MRKDFEIFIVCLRAITFLAEVDFEIFSSFRAPSFLGDALDSTLFITFANFNGDLGILFRTFDVMLYSVFLDVNGLPTRLPNVFDGAV